MFNRGFISRPPDCASLAPSAPSPPGARIPIRARVFPAWSACNTAGAHHPAPAPFQFEHAFSQLGQLVIPPARIIQLRRRPLLGLLDQSAAYQPLQGTIEGGGPESH